MANNGTPLLLDKKKMSEEDIKLQFITPAITAKWDIRKITMETNITAAAAVDQPL